MAANAVVASGGSTTSITLTNNYWGTTVPAEIGAFIQDKLDTAALPTVVFTPVLTGRPVCPVGAAAAHVVYSGGGTNIPLSATFTSSSGVVNDGTATFTSWWDDGHRQSGHGQRHARLC